METPEFTGEMLLAGGTLLILLGLLVGWLIGRRTSTAGQKYREVERKLDQVLQDKKSMCYKTKKSRTINTKRISSTFSKRIPTHVNQHFN